MLEKKKEKNSYVIRFEIKRVSIADLAQVAHCPTRFYCFRLFPPGVLFSNKPMVEQNASVKASPRSALDIKPGTENKPPDLSYSKDAKVEQPATCGRFSYTTNPFLVNPRPVPQIPTVEMKPVAPTRKTVRDIRLRPRQTLCSKCKCAIHDSLKGNNNASPRQGHNTLAAETSENVPSDKKALKVKLNVVSHTTSVPNDTQRKRRSSNQTPMVLLEDIKLKYMKPSDKKGSKVSNSKNLRVEFSADKISSRSGHKDSHKSEPKPVNSKTRSIRSSSLGSCSTSSFQNGDVQNWLQQIDNASETNLTAIQTCKHIKRDKNTANEKNSKPSPAIKISIGDGAILKIPPRLPAEEAKFNEQQSWPDETSSSDFCNTALSQIQHKKSKKAAKKAKDKDKCRATLGIEKSEIPDSDSIDSFKAPKKHKKKHRHKHDESSVILHRESNWYDESVTGQLSESQNNEPVSQEPNDVITETLTDSPFDDKPVPEPVPEHPRPRLLYTWKQNQGLSRVASSPKQTPANMSPSYLFKSSPVLPLRVSNSPHRRKNASPARVISASPNWHITSPQNVILKDYPLRSKSISGHSSSGLSSENLAASEHGVNQVSEDSQSHSSGVDSNISDFCDADFPAEMNSEDDFFFHEESPGLDRGDHDEEDGSIKPLMMKIQTQNVSGCVLEEGREVRVGDIVWGKIPGFPWWPGRVSSITVTQRDNDVVITQLAKVCWFGSNTMSHVHCADLYPFLQDFKARYNKKKKGQYRVAIKQATIAAQMLTDAREDDFSFEGYE